MSRRGRMAGVVTATALLGLIVVPAAGAAPIGGASYKGEGRGDVDKVGFNVSEDGKVIGSLDVGFDSRCRQGGKNYTNKNTSIVFYTTKIRSSGKFKARDVTHFHGKSEAVVKGRFSEDGRSARGRFIYEGDYAPGSIPAVHCHAEGRFRAATKAKPEGGGEPGGPRNGTWTGTTAQGLDIVFDVEDDAISAVLFEARLDCVREDPTLGPTNFSKEYERHIHTGRIEGSSFSGSQEGNRISGSFDGGTATGVVSVTDYYDELELATCSTPGDVSFTATPDRP